MAIYRFRVILDDEEEVSRVLEIKSSQTFQQLHEIIVKCFEVPVPSVSTIFISDNDWHKEGKIGDFTIDEAEKNPKISSYVHDPHQRFLYELEAGVHLQFTIELVKILGDDPSLELPDCVGGEGEIPKYYFKRPAPVETTEDDAGLSGEEALLKELASMAMGMSDEDEPGEDDLADADDDSDNESGSKKGSSDDEDYSYSDDDDEDDDEFGGYGDGFDEGDLDGFGEEDFRE